MSTTRLETFADGVFAIAATLLVLEIQLPGDDIGHGLVDLWPSYFAYALSFLTIGIMWVNHHVVLTFIREADRTFLFINLFLLMAVAFLPFPTGVFAEHIGEDGAREAAGSGSTRTGAFCDRMPTGARSAASTGATCRACLCTSPPRSWRFLMRRPRS